ncbi:MAG: hypothetical protein ACRDPI_03740, partial [Nocardioidaceae bacterium]
GRSGLFGTTPDGTATQTSGSVHTDHQSAAITSDTARYGSWPDARTTGANWTNKSHRGGLTITKNGTVLSHTIVNGQLTIRADNVRIRDVVVRTNSFYGILVAGKNALITRTTINGAGAMAGMATQSGGQFIARHINVFGSEDGVRLASRCRLVDSYVHGLKGHQGSHYDAVTADGFVGWQIRHNTLLNPHSQTSVTYVGDPRSGGSAGIYRNNYVAGGGYSIYGGPGKNNGIRVVDNVFSTRYFRNGGYWGVAAHWSSAGSNTWSGNTWIDGPRKGRTVRQ